MRAGRAAALALAVVTVAGCGTSSHPSSSPSSGPSSTASPAGHTFTNPVWEQDFPDPQAISVGKAFYAFSTNGKAGNVPVLRSPDLVHWTAVGDAMPRLASWITPGKTWAPEVMAFRDNTSNRYVLYYTSTDRRSGRQCVGRAVARRPTGPFTDRSSHALVCQVHDGGSIDASPFRDDDGRLYLYWKNDGNCCGKDTWIYVQPLSRSGLRLTGRPTRLFRQTARWEDYLVEAPFMWRHGSGHYLFYSANDYASDKYAAGYARCASPTGPCHKAAENPVLSTGGGAAGPGHVSLIEVGDRTWMLYRAWPPDAIGAVSPGRQLWIDEVTWEHGRPHVHGPTSTSQPDPR